jgi:predicted acyltransferase
MSPEDPLLSSSISNDPMPRRKTERLVSLDVLRGATIALMIFVDFCGESTPAVDHSAWDGVRLADFVMPSFDFIVGVSLVMSMQVSDVCGCVCVSVSKWVND